ncbi:hypothetical protein NLC26_02850 [Candidatus Aminicenantes bacterium AC-708-M15]|jgi:hypothetical protein|nr:hypothetical protein [SCandidatus Aminicenantes bacterium Aminicenantia_JdfR_composite]MCP2597655.1 hypothetical protein [Candidatus Aminicenantes bacterium AC-335-G13]MCP2598785.1 hypothetical protein [Candidatus Aminicenantes bacterium AC-335-L06]MCP2604401.1 hypothetical protein [Candidatus Aminicenantes bacterium AC-708-M15]MCP2619046.1 hypothetical protein [Candidatus Aminicenantes bacterium AC-335-A11]
MISIIGGGKLFSDEEDLRRFICCPCQCWCFSVYEHCDGNDVLWGSKYVSWCTDNPAGRERTFS